MPSRTSTSKSIGTPTHRMETRNRARIRLAAEAAQAALDAEAAKNARPKAANDTISPIAASFAGSLPPRSLSPPPLTRRTPSKYAIPSAYDGIPNGFPRTRLSSTPSSAGRTLPKSEISSGLLTPSPHGSTPSSYAPTASPTDSELSIHLSKYSPTSSPPCGSPLPVPSTGRTPLSAPSSSSCSPSSSSSSNSPPTSHSNLPLPVPYRSGLSDTPPVIILGNWSNVPREHQDRSVSRQLYLHGTLTSVRNASSSPVSALLWLVYYRLILYPVKMYSRQALLAWLVLAAFSVVYVYLNGESLREISGVEIQELIQPLCAAYMYTIWVYLHVFDLYRGIEYLLDIPAGIFPGAYSDFSVRVCAAVRPVARIAIAGCVLLVLLEDDMTLSEWYHVAEEIFKATFTLGIVCGVVEVAIYWVAGFFAEPRKTVYGAGEGELVVFERWEVEYILPWGTGVAVFFAIKFFWFYLGVAWERGWAVFPGRGTAYRGAGSQLEDVWVAIQGISPPQWTGFVVRV